MQLKHYWTTSLFWQFNSWNTSKKREHVTYKEAREDKVRKDSWWLPCNHGWQKRDRFHIQISVDWKTQWRPISAQLMGSVRRKKPHTILIVLPDRAEWLLSRKGQKISVRPPKPLSRSEHSWCRARMWRAEGCCCRALLTHRTEWLCEAVISPWQGGASMV